MFQRYHIFKNYCHSSLGTHMHLNLTFSDRYFKFQAQIIYLINNHHFIQKHSTRNTRYVLILTLLNSVPLSNRLCF